MAPLAAAFASSHSVMLTAELDDWLNRFVEADQKIAHIDAEGNRCRYADLLARVPVTAASLVEPEAIARRFDDAQAAMAKLREAILGAQLDTLVVIGDDQQEFFPASTQPAIGIYYGATIRNAAQRDPATLDWYKRAQERRREKGAAVDHPCDEKLATHLIEGLTRQGFDVTAIKAMAPEQSEGHAYSFVHHKYLAGSGIAIVPVFLNTYYPPNQPTPARCRALGEALRQLIRGLAPERRIGIMASGGLSHFSVDEALDHGVIEAIRRKDLGFLADLPVWKLQAGSSEIRNWIVAAAAASDLDFAWSAYVPGYRTPALTGTGLGFAQWS